VVNLLLLLAARGAVEGAHHAGDRRGGVAEAVGAVATNLQTFFAKQGWNAVPRSLPALPSLP